MGISLLDQDLEETLDPRFFMVLALEVDREFKLHFSLKRSSDFLLD